MAKVQDNRILLGRRSTCLVTLAQRVSSEQENVKSTHETARTACPKPDPNDVM